LAHSLGTIGDAFDNAAVESFWARMQTELLDTRKWMTRVELSTAIFDWVEVFYHRTRRHSSLGMLSPAAYERLTPAPPDPHKPSPTSGGQINLLWGPVSPACWAGGPTTMKRHRHTPEQIVRKLREGERLLNEGKDLTEVVRHLEIAESTWNRWRSQYGGMKADEAKRLRQLETENARLKKLLAEAELDKSMLKELAEGNF
jgi:putative transposase